MDLSAYTAERFWSRFERRGACLRWTRDHRIYWMGRDMSVSRVAAVYAGLLDYVDQPGYVTHTCHDPQCFAPAHLSITTATTGRPRKPTGNANAFWELLDKQGECWLWTVKPVRRTKQITTLWNGRAQSVSRLAAVYGNLITHDSARVLVRHECGNPLCFKPSHLRIVPLSRKRHALAHALSRQYVFWTKVDRTGGCWLWLGKRTPDKRVRYGGGTYTPMQIAKHLSVHRYPLDHARVWVHECGNPRCIRPDHLV